MTEVYRKHGRVVRYEHGALVEVVESGEAVDDGSTFVVRPLRTRIELPAPDAARVLATARAIEELGNVERLLVSDGIAEHECDGVRWSERSERIHVSLITTKLPTQPERALIDVATFDLEPIARVAALLARIGSERAAPPSLRLAPAVTAALLPSLVRIIDVQQAAAAQPDGKGQPVDDHHAPPWPNAYRPSYRVRPVDMPFHLRATPFGTIDRNAPEAVSLLAPPERNRARVLVIDGDDVYPATITVTHVRAVGEPVMWFPYAAGSFGAELLL